MPTLPPWFVGCYNKDYMARMCEPVQQTPFLYTGVVPRVGMQMYLQLNYVHDGSHPDAFRGWARLWGEVTHVFDTPEVGLYAVYEGQKKQLSDDELQQRRAGLPSLPPTMFGPNTHCNCCRTAEQIVAKHGAVHGQRIKARLELTGDDQALWPQLGGQWEAELICNDNLENMWVVYAMQPAGIAAAPAGA